MSHPVPANPDLILDGRPFTLADGREAGLSRKELRRIVTLGVVRPVCHAVYVDAGAEDTLPLRGRGGEGRAT